MSKSLRKIPGFRPMPSGERYTARLDFEPDNPMAVQIFLTSDSVRASIKRMSYSWVHRFLIIDKSLGGVLTARHPHDLLNPEKELKDLFEKHQGAAIEHSQGLEKLYGFVFSKAPTKNEAIRCLIDASMTKIMMTIGELHLLGYGSKPVEGDAPDRYKWRLFIEYEYYLETLSILHESFHKNDDAEAIKAKIRHLSEITLSMLAVSVTAQQGETLSAATLASTLIKDKVRTHEYSFMLTDLYATCLEAIEDMIASGKFDLSVLVRRVDGIFRNLLLSEEQIGDYNNRESYNTSTKDYKFNIDDYSIDNAIVNDPSLRILEVLEGLKVGKGTAELRDLYVQDLSLWGNNIEAARRMGRKVEYVEQASKRLRRMVGEQIEKKF